MSSPLVAPQAPVLRRVVIYFSNLCHDHAAGRIALMRGAVHRPDQLAQMVKATLLRLMHGADLALDGTHICG
ncbi:MAG: hypothetical protein ACLQO1_20455 [Steroidobacteraceae bacterium]